MTKEQAEQLKHLKNESDKVNIAIAEVKREMDEIIFDKGLRTVTEAERSRIQELRNEQKRLDEYHKKLWKEIWELLL